MHCCPECHPERDIEEDTWRTPRHPTMLPSCLGISMVAWPSTADQWFVKSCRVCVRDSTPRKEPLISSKLPSYPWQRVESDLFTLKGSQYLSMVDYFSRWPELAKLTSTASSASIIAAMKPIFAKLGIPQMVMNDNGPQYASREFCHFARADFSHIASSLHSAQSNGLAEGTVQIMKTLLQEAWSDPHMALLWYRTTPVLWCSVTLAELMIDVNSEPLSHCWQSNWVWNGQITKSSITMTVSSRKQRSVNSMVVTKYDHSHWFQMTQKYGLVLMIPLRQGES